MKKVLLVVVTLLYCLPLFAQVQDRPGDMHHNDMHHTMHRHHHGSPPFAYIGASTGINNAAGYLGFNFDIPVSRYVTVGAGAGVSSWGNKLHVDAKYFLKRYQHGWAFGGGFTSNSGQVNYRTRMPEPTVSGIKQTVYLNLEAQHNVYFAVYHYWSLGRRYNRFFTEIGWSVPLVASKFTQTSPSPAVDPLTPTAADRINKLAPGGLVLGFGFSFGLHH